jgi:tetratricopeptide (TPR) repeat protein
MSRLYLILLFIGIHIAAFAQPEIKKYLEFAKEKYQQGDYIHSLQYYEKAMKIDSSAVNILWEYALALKAYKDYRKAEYYFGDVFDREGAQIYPESLLFYGLMLKHNKKYDEAIELFKKAKKVYRDDRRGYLYLKSRQELSSCLWAKNAVTDTSKLIFEHLPEHINTPDAEFAHRIINDQLIFSSLRADSIGQQGEIYATSYKTRLFKAPIEGEEFGAAERIEELAKEAYNTGNGALSLDGKRFYFSKCETSNFNYICKIMVAQFQEGAFKNIDELGEIINASGANTTMPHVAEMDGEEVLFFVSNRDDGKGGMDIWYSTITKGNQYGKPRNIKRLNTMDNELAPFFNSAEQTLYFSSSWHEGFGGYDVFKSEYKNNMFAAPVNMGYPINSPANDLYYFQTLTGDTAFVSSNRIGVNYSKNPTCCSDIFLARQPIAPPPPTIEESLEELNKRLPVTLYFHNDIPNPRSWDTTTIVNYMDSYREYTKMMDQYKNEYAKGLKGDAAADAKDDIEDFFLEYVDQGVKDLELFRDLLFAELVKGRKFRLTVKGFASPLAKTDYNVNLTKRRIASLVNYLREYNNGQFIPFFDGTHESGGKIEVVEIPFGEYQAATFTSDNPNDVRNSVYSRAAAIERKIEVQSIEQIDDPEKTTEKLIVAPPIFDAGKVKSGTVILKEFLIQNLSDSTVEIASTRIPCDCNTLEIETKSIAPGEQVKALVTFNTEGYQGKEVKSVYLQYENQEIRLIITAEVE